MATTGGVDVYGEFRFVWWWAPNGINFIQYQRDKGKRVWHETGFGFMPYLKDLEVFAAERNAELEERR